MLTRIQLNLLGRRSYLSSVVSLASGGNVTPGTISLENNDDDSAEQAYGTDFDVNRKYLTFSWWLLNRGWVDVRHRVEHAVRQVFGHLSPRDTVTLETFAKLSGDVRSLVEGSGAAWLPFLLPQANMEEFVLRESGVLDSDPSLPPSSPSPAASTSLRRLLDETADLIESPHFTHVHSQILDAGFSVLLQDKLVAGVFDTPAVSASAIDDTPDGVSRAVLLPKILSVLTRQAHVIGNGMPNEYLQAMEGVRDLEGFAAVVYSSNWQAEVVPDEVVGGAKEGGAQSSSSEAGSSRAPAAQGSTMGESSIVLVGGQEEDEPQQAAQSSLFDSVWEKASSGN
jgi:peroxin-3